MFRDTIFVLHNHAKQYKTHWLKLTQKKYRKPDSGTVSYWTTLIEILYGSEKGGESKDPMEYACLSSSSSDDSKDE